MYIIYTTVVLSVFYISVLQRSFIFRTANVIQHYVE